MKKGPQFRRCYVHQIFVDKTKLNGICKSRRKRTQTIGKMYKTTSKPSSPTPKFIANMRTQNEFPYKPLRKKKTFYMKTN